MSAFPTIPEFTWGGKPAANSVAVRTRTRIRISDIGPAGIVLVSDGASWVADGAQCIGRSAVPASVTGTTSETVLATITLPAGLMGPNGGVEIRSVWSYTNSANNKTMRARLGGIAGAAYLARGETTTAMTSDIRRIRARGSAASQVGSFPATGSVGLGANLSAPVTSSNDMTQSQDIVLTGQLGLGTETLTLETYEVWLLP